MTMRTLRPGLLVSLKTSLKGGVTYERRDIDKVEGDPQVVAQWETIKRVDDQAELERATKVRGKCRSVVTAVCAQSEFGLLCPMSKVSELEKALAESRKLTDDFNVTASTCRVEVYSITGQIASTDQEAVRAITSEVKDLLASMQEGIAEANPERIREAANKARQVGAMLTDDVQNKVGAAIQEARDAARAIVKRVQKDGEKAAEVVQSLKIEALRAARFAFLDFDEADKDSEPQAQPGRALDVTNPAIHTSAVDSERTVVDFKSPFYVAKLEV